MADPAEMQAKLKILGDVYAARLPEKFSQLEVASNQWLAHHATPQPAWDEDGFKALYLMVHRLSGSGKTFGFSALSEAARELEIYLKNLGEAREALGGEQRDHVRSLLGKLIGSFARRETVELRSMPAASASSKDIVARRAFVVEDDHQLAEDLRIQLNYYGYEVSVFHTLDVFRRAMQQYFCGVVVMDINFPEDAMGGIHVMMELQRGRAVPLPVIYLSSLGELDVRLGAVRAGGIAYLSKPVNIGDLVDALDVLMPIQTAAAYRIMIVDDDAELAAYYAAALEQAGMMLKVINDPLEVLKPLFDFMPDLILIDMYMPGCNGMDMAKAIRQINSFVSIPIVFLSAETNMDKQLDALGLGVDDFLTKPIRTEHLVSTINSRVRRSLLLRSFMVRDSLTGLLNHTTIKEQLSHELARAKRQGMPLAFAMVDIDHFKNVNDTYGHPAGDRVIKSLSRLLKQRLRENDLVGRYGGEEFAVVLVDADGAQAMKIMDAIRNDFAQLRHLEADREFLTSFSCGVADARDYDDAGRLTDAADKALYKAKRAGRNQVMQAHARPV